MSTIQKWGNSQGLRLAKAILQEAQLNVGDEVDISVEKGRIIIEPTTKVRGRYDLQELLSKMPKSTELKNWIGTGLLGRKSGKCPVIFRRKVIS